MSTQDNRPNTQDNRPRPARRRPGFKGDVAVMVVVMALWAATAALTLAAWARSGGPDRGSAASAGSGGGGGAQLRLRD